MHLHNTRNIQYTFVGTAVAVAGLGLGAASAAGAFSPTISAPNTALEAEQMQALQAEYLPAILGIEAAQQEGGQFTLPPDIQAALQSEGVHLSGGTVSPEQTAHIQGLQTQLASLQSQLASTPRTTTGTFSGHGVNSGGSNRAYTDLQHQIQNIQSQITQAQRQGGNTVNFAGQGTAQTQGTIEQQLAAGRLAEGQQFDPQFIAQQLAEEQQANPQQFQARAAEYQDIQNELNNPQVSPVAQTMENQVQERVNAGSSLTPEEQAMLNAAVAGQGGENGANYSQYLTTGQPGEQRALSNAGAGADFLASGTTPADVAYREQQAAIGNLASYAGGTTPESQFGQVSGAGQPAFPATSTNYQPGFNGAAVAQQGAAGGITQFGENVNQSLNVSNPWTFGLSSVLQGGNALASAGVF